MEDWNADANDITVVPTGTSGNPAGEEDIPADDESDPECDGIRLMGSKILAEDLKIYW